MASVFVPRHLRKGYVNRGGSKDQQKQQAFRRAAQYSKRFITQSASFLERPTVAPQYAEYCGVCDREALRKGGSK